MKRRLTAILGVGILPWSMILAGGEATLIFTVGLLDLRGLYFVDLPTYLTAYTVGLPQFIRAWPVGVGIYVLALGSAVSGVLFEREDRRVTAILLVLVGLTQLTFAWGFSRRPLTVALPVATVASWTVVWWFDWETLVDGVPAAS